MSPDQLVTFALISTTLALVVVAVMLWIARRESLPKKAESVERPELEPSTGSETPEEDPEQLVAVLTAAASTALGTAVRVRHVHVHRESRGETWSRAGRMDVMVSHRVVPKR